MKKFLRVLAVAMLLLVIALPALAENCNHEWSHDYTVYKQPTCTEKGAECKYCVKCHALDKAGQSRDVDEVAHDYCVFIRHETEATCTVDGVDVYKCANCSSEDWRHIGKNSSNHQNVITGTYGPVEGDCKTKGWKATEYCTDCQKHIDKVETEYGSHNWVQDVEKSTCTEQGWEGMKCTICGAWQDKVMKPLAEHDTGTWILVSAATCQKKASYYAYCKECDTKVEFEYGEKAAHKYDDSKAYVVKETTCSEKGKGGNKCVWCGKEITWDVATIAHDFKPVTVKATCEKDGYLAQECKVCGKQKDVTTLPATGHTYILHETAAKDCQAGESYKECKDCGKVIEKVTTKAPKDHKAADEWTIVRQPNAYQEGKAIKSCVYCGTQMAKKYFTNAASLGNAKVDTSKKDSTTSSSSSSSKNNTTSSSSASKNNTAATTSTPTVKAVVAVKPVVVKEWKLGEKFKIADGVFMTITLNAETNKYDVVVEGVDNIETAKIAFVAADATEAPADEAYTDLIKSNWVIETADVDEAAILYIVID